MIDFAYKTDWAQFNLPMSRLKEIVSECEKGSFGSFWLNDHFFYPGKPEMPTFECWTVLSVLAALSSKLRLGTMVLCNSYRYPSVLAKAAATLDNLSDGRLDFGIGAGSFYQDNNAYGIAFDEKASIRIAKLKEAVLLTKAMWTQEKANFNGKYYTVKDAICSPKPIQKPHPPIWIGGAGEKLTFRVIAEVGDGCNMNHTDPQEFARKLSILRMHCQKVGRNPNEIKSSWQASVFVGKTEDEAKKKARTYRDSHFREDTRRTPDEAYFADNVVGTPNQCIKKIEGYTDLGCRNFFFMFPESQQVGDMSGIRLFGQEVIPSFRNK